MNNDQNLSETIEKTLNKNELNSQNIKKSKGTTNGTKNFNHDPDGKINENL